MEAALVSAATGALKPVLEKLGALVGDKYKRFKGVRDDIKSLTRELTAVEAFLLKMSEEEDPDIQDKVWMNEVRELSYDMEDSIDDFMQSVGSEHSNQDGFLDKIKNSLGKMKARRQIGNEIGDLKKQIIEVAERNERYKAREAFSKAKNTTIDPRALAIFRHASNLVGIDEPKAEIIKLLTEGASTQETMKLVSIVGSGGLGKTTLANQVYEDLKEKFECQAFLSVSRNPDIMNILRTILSAVSGQLYAHTEAGSIQQLIIKITDFLVDKRYFVVVDDIWDVDTWEVIKHAFPVTSSGSIIITTTRINYVAESCRSTSISGDIYCIRPLDMVYSRQLFYTRLFNTEENCPSYLKKVSEHILKKCAGLPLAIIAISGLLANIERTEGPWKQVEDSIGRALERNPSVEGMMKILDLRGTSVCELPASIVNLKRLVHLLVNHVVTFPCGISKLQALEKLKMVSVYSQSSNVLQEFEQLQSLKELTLDFEDYSSADRANVENESKKAIIVASLKSLGNLLSLSVWDCPEFIGESLCPMPLSLQKFAVWGSSIPHVPKWVGSLLNLQNLHLEYVRAEQKDFYILGGLPVLRYLILEIDDSEIRNTSLTKEPEVTRVIVCSEVGFPCLRKFVYVGRHGGMNVTFAAGAMPKVDDLFIAFDADIIKSPGTGGAFDLGIENLPSLVKITCIVWGDDSSRVEAADAIREAANAHPNRPSLSFSSEWVPAI